MIDFIKINKQAFFFSITTLIFLSFIRIVELLLFGSEIPEVLTELLLMGFRFDLRVVATTLLLFIYLPALIFVGLKNWQKFSIWTTYSLSFLLIIINFLSFIDIGYFTFFGTPIDILIFGLIEDGTVAVIKSILSDYRLVFISIIFIVFIYFLTQFFIKKINNITTKKNTPLSKRIILLLLIIPITFLAARGTWTTFPLSKQYTAISDNSFINSLTQNAIYHLYNAFSDRSKSHFNASTQAVLKNAQVKDLSELKQKANLNNLIKTTPKNIFLAKNPPSIIFVQMEGWSSQIALTDSKNTLGNFNQHRLKDYFFNRFFSNGYGTNPTLDYLLLNSPITPLSQSDAYKTNFSTSNILPFKKKGYKTIFLSGGYASWRNHDKFWVNQGFDQYIGRTTIAKAQGKSNNTWGVYEEKLFNFLKDDLQKQTKPTFYYVLTTNNHPPVELPKNYTIPPFNLSSFNNNNGQIKKMLSGFSYQSNALGNFLSWLKKSPLKNNVIVVATGDHILKGFDNYNNPEKIYAKYGVATYFYLPKQYDKLKNINKNIAASHVDLFPTLFELSLSNAKYYQFGTALMNKKIKGSYGWIENKAFILKNGIINAQTKKYHPFTKNNLVSSDGYDLTKNQKNILSQEKYRSFLKEYLLYQDKEK
jgi:phosphoglycerol transferase MdoB-like AlkP superfamily enzyme